MKLTVTDSAAEELKRIIVEQGFTKDKPVYLRLKILGGGCAGFTHKLDLDESVSEKLDEILIINGVDVVVDKRSAMYVDGSTIDYLNDINKRGFLVTNPGAKSTCGCGSSISM